MSDASKGKSASTAPSLSELEADVAYFDARLSLLGRPSTRYQKAQQTAYRMLEGLLVQHLVCLRSRSPGRPDSKKSGLPGK